MGRCQEQPKADDLSETGTRPAHLHQKEPSPEEDEQKASVHLPAKLP